MQFELVTFVVLVQFVLATVVVVIQFSACNSAHIYKTF